MSKYCNVCQVGTERSEPGFLCTFFFLFFLLERLVVAAEHCENSLEDLLREGKPVR